MLKHGVKIILAIIIAGFVISYSSGHIAKISVSIAERRASSFSLEKRSEMAAQLEKDFTTIGDNDAKIEHAFPSEDTILDFTATMDNLGKASGRKQSLNFTTVYKGETFDYNIGLDGNIETLIDYLKMFEALPYVTTISSIDFVGPAGGWLENSSISVKAMAIMR